MKFVRFDRISTHIYDTLIKIVEKNHVINGVNVHTQKALPKDFEKGGQNNNNNNGNNRQGNRNNNFSSKFNLKYILYFNSINSNCLISI